MYQNSRLQENGVYKWENPYYVLKSGNLLQNITRKALCKGVVYALSIINVNIEQSMHTKWGLKIDYQMFREKRYIS